MKVAALICFLIMHVQSIELSKHIKELQLLAKQLEVIEMQIGSCSHDLLWEKKLLGASNDIVNLLIGRCGHPYVSREIKA